MILSAPYGSPATFSTVDRQATLTRSHTTMTVSGQFRPRSEDVAWEEFDGEFVVLDLESGKYFSLAGGAALVWHGLMHGHSVESLCAAVHQGSPMQAEIVRLVQGLLDHRLIVPASVSQPDAQTSLPSELAACSGPFRIDVFDDLADLLLADPIHDVDPSTGWPVLPPTED